MGSKLSELKKTRKLGTDITLKVLYKRGGGQRFEKMARKKTFFPHFYFSFLGCHPVRPAREGGGSQREKTGGPRQKSRNSGIVVPLKYAQFSISELFF
jgi:hypothetical protein